MGKHKTFQICQRCKRPLDWENFEIISETRINRNGTIRIQQNHRRICRDCLNMERQQVGGDTRYTCNKCKRKLPVNMFNRTHHRKPLKGNVAPRLLYSWTCKDCLNEAQKQREMLGWERKAHVAHKKLTPAETREAKEKRLDEFCDRALAMGLSYGKLKALERRERLKIEQEEAKRDADSLLSCLREKFPSVPQGFLPA